MPVHITIGVKAPSLGAVSDALRLATGIDYEPHDSLYLGEYDLFRLPEEVRVKYHFVAAEGEWDYPQHKEYAILIVAGQTERPDFVWRLAAGLGFESSILEESKW